MVSISKCIEAPHVICVKLSKYRSIDWRLDGPFSMLFLDTGFIPSKFLCSDFDYFFLNIIRSFSLWNPDLQYEYRMSDAILVSKKWRCRPGSSPLDRERSLHDSAVSCKLPPPRRRPSERRAKVIAMLRATMEHIGSELSILRRKSNRSESHHRVDGNRDLGEEDEGGGGGTYRGDGIRGDGERRAA